MSDDIFAPFSPPERVGSAHPADQVADFGIRPLLPVLRTSATEPSQYRRRSMRAPC